MRIIETIKLDHQEIETVKKAHRWFSVLEYRMSDRQPTCDIEKGVAYLRNSLADTLTKNQVQVCIETLVLVKHEMAYRERVYLDSMQPNGPKVEVPLIADPQKFFKDMCENIRYGQQELDSALVVFTVADKALHAVPASEEDLEPSEDEPMSLMDQIVVRR